MDFFLRAVGYRLCHQCPFPVSLTNLISVCSWEDSLHERRYHEVKAGDNK